MQTEKVSPAAISEAALRVYSQDDLEQMEPQRRRTFLSSVARRLEQGSVSEEELKGIRELADNDLWHPAFGRQYSISQP